MALLHISRSVLATLLIAAASLWLMEGRAADKKAAQSKTPEDLFTSTQIFRIQIEIPEAGLQTLREYHWGGWGGQQKRPVAKATVREGGKVYSEVAVHLKGAAGSFRDVDSEPSLTLNFDKFVKDQTFHGVQRISLNNSVQDRSLLNELISRELFAAAGVPVPRATHAKVELNGRDLGLYVLVEACNKQFLARHFKKANGNLYDGGFLRDVTDDLERSSGSGPDNHSDLKKLADAAQEPDYSNRLARVSQVLDLDRFITYLAMDVITCDWDGYAINRNNYRIYHDPDSDKFVFIPHGLDQMFGVMRARTTMSIYPRMNGLVAKAILQTPQGRQQYRDRIAQLMTNVVHVESITNRIWELEARLRPVLAEQGPGKVRFQENEASRFCRRIADRAASVRQQLGAPTPAPKVGPAGLTQFDWKPRADHGKPLLDESTEQGRRLLHIRANGSAVGVWSTKLQLDAGRYRLQGKAKAQGVVPDAGDRRGGAGLRTSDRRFVQKLTGDTDWTEVTFDFEVQDGDASQFNFMGAIEGDDTPVELICELRAAKGEVWFDRESLRLTRR